VPAAHVIESISLEKKIDRRFLFNISSSPNLFGPRRCMSYNIINIYTYYTGTLRLRRRPNVGIHRHVRLFFLNVRFDDCYRKPIAYNYYYYRCCRARENRAGIRWLHVHYSDVKRSRWYQPLLQLSAVVSPLHFLLAVSENGTDFDVYIYVRI